MDQLARLMILSAAARRRGRGPRRRLPVQQPPTLLQGKYLLEMKRYLQPAFTATRTALWPVMPRLLESARAELERHDAGEAARARRAVNVARAGFNEQQRQLTTLARRIGEETSSYQKGQLEKQLRAAVGVTVPLRDPRLGPKLEGFTEENVRLISSIPTRYFDEVEKLVLDAVAKGRRWESLAEEIDQRFDVGESRAALIARDQVGKFYGAVAQARQETLGITSYVWRTVRDSRVRDEHREREGEVFEWASPPEDGHPGEPINCRCYAEPNIDQLLEDLEAA